MNENLLLAAAGLIGGFIAGLTGIGTGIIMLAVIPMVLHHFGVPTHYYVSITIANAVFVTLLSSFTNVLTTLRQRTFYHYETFWVSIAAVIFSFIVFETVAKREFYSKEVFNSIIIFFMFVIIIQTFKKLKLSNVRDEHVTKPRMLLTGSAAGTIAALTGLGGGTVIIPLLNLWLRIDIKKAKSISFGTITAIALWLSINNIFLEPDTGIPGSVGLIVFPMAIPLIIGVVIGSPLGVIASEKMSSRTVTIIFLIMTSFVTLQKIYDLIRLN